VSIGYERLDEFEQVSFDLERVVEVVSLGFLVDARAARRRLVGGLFVFDLGAVVMHCCQLELLRGDILRDSLF
jgi:hypothetical protein